MFVSVNELNARLIDINNVIRIGSHSSDCVNFSIQQWPLGTVHKRNGIKQELIELFPKPKWSLLDSVTGKCMRRPGNIVCFKKFQNSRVTHAKERVYGVVLKYESGGMRVKTTTGTVGVPYENEIFWQTTFHSFISQIYYGPETLDQKIRIVKQIYNLMLLSDLKDVLIPGDRKFVTGMNKMGFTYGWPSNFGLDQKREIKALDLKERDLYRVGYLGGTNFSVSEMSYDELAIPYRYNPYALNKVYFFGHQYKRKIDAIAQNKMNRLNFILSAQGVKSLDENEFSRIHKLFSEFQGELTKYGFDTKYFRYGLMGYAAPWWVDRNHFYKGGAIQITTPLNGFDLERIGVLYQYH